MVYICTFLIILVVALSILCLVLFLNLRSERQNVRDLVAELADRTEARISSLAEDLHTVREAMISSGTLEREELPPPPPTSRRGGSQ